MPKSEIRELNGYRLIYEPNHPSSMKNDNWRGYIYEHILIAEEFLGRPLNDDEVVHHLDFNRTNNRKENLLVLLKSQHSKLHLWIEARAFKNESLEQNWVNLVEAKSIIPKFCISCGRTLQEKQIKACSLECSSQKRRKVERPSKSDLLKDIHSLSFLAIGRKYGVSDNAVRKWAKAYGIDMRTPSQAESTLSEGLETSGEVESS